MEKIVRTAAPPDIDFSKDWADFSSEEKNQIRDALLDMTGGRCAYTGKKIDKELAVIDHFIPLKINQSSDWNNLYVVNPITEQLKNDKYDEKLIRPDEDDYEFDRYFDFDKSYIIPNPNANSYDKKRAEITINTFGLNHENILSDRSRELSKYLDGIRQQIGKMPKNGNDRSFDADYSDFSFNFYLKKIREKLIEKFEAADNKTNDYISSINITKYFCIENLKVENLKDKKEIYFLGENGDGKTILLQAIVLALKGLSYSSDKHNNLIDNDFAIEFEGEKRDFSYDDFAIEIEGENQPTYKYSYKDNVHKDIYAYGIGRLRNNNRERDDSGYLSLFDYDTYLTNPIDWFNEVYIAESKKIGKLKLNSVIQLFEKLLGNDVKIEAKKDEVGYIFEEKNTPLEFHQLSDGYRSVLIWVSDLLSRLAESQPDVENLEDYKAVVLVDEIGSFLHPLWEYQIVRKLREWFGGIQWFFTTHSPIVALGASKKAVFYKLYKEDGITKVSEPFHAEAFDNRMLSSFVTSPLFNLPTARPATFQGNKFDLETGDYLYSQIRREVKKRVKDKPLQDTEIQDMISELLDEYERTGKI